MPPELRYLAQGLVLGFSVAAPVGPIGVLCIRRTLADGRRAGLVSGLGAATADACYGAVAAFGLQALAALLVQQQLLLRLGGGAFLIYLGARTFLAPPGAKAAAPARALGLLGAYGSTFLLTLTNPATIFSFAAIFAGLGVGSGTAPTEAAVMVVGVLLGSAAWWLLLTGVVGALRERFTPAAMRWVNQLSGVLIACFGVLVLASLLPLDRR